MAPVRQIAVLCPSSWEPYRQLIVGVTDFVAERRDCELNISPDATELSLANLKGWPGDGVIAPLHTTAELRLARSLKVPVVNISGALRKSSLPRVTYDNAAIGRFAAEHLLQTGARHFAYYGLRGFWFSHERKRGFMASIHEAGGQVSVLDTQPGYASFHTWDYWAQPLEQWLKKLHLPVGLMAVHDLRASLVVTSCLRLGLRVPDDVAVIGVDNEEIACRFCPVPLSSVARNERQTGYEAAALLYRLMTGEPSLVGDILVPPDRVVKRRSTDLATVENQQLAEVIQYIREHLGEEFGVKGLMRVTPNSRRWLERQFHETFRCSPSEYILRLRVERAKELLTDGKDIAIGRIARECGFSGSRQFAAIFRRLVGTTPTAYRRQHIQP